MQVLIWILLYCLVITDVCGDPPKYDPDEERTSQGCQQKNSSNVAVYAMIAVICVLIAMIVSLLAYIYKLKHSKTQILDDEINITVNNSTQKYERHESTEPNEITYKTETTNDNKRLLSRQGSKMTILDYPDHSLSRPIQDDEKPIITPTVSKTLQPYGDHKEHIKKLCEAILNRTANNSSIDTNILNENHEESEIQQVQKSTSTRFVDKDESFENFPSPSQVKKLQKFPALNQNGSEKANELKINERIPLNAAKFSYTEKSSQKEINDKPEDICEPSLDSNKFVKNNKLVEPKETDDEDLDEVYDDLPKITRPVTLTKEHLDDVYDNPSNIPVGNSVASNTKDNGQSANDFYDSMPCNKPVHFDDEHHDDVYDNPKSNKPIIAESSDAKSEPRRSRANDSDDDEYDLPRRHGRGIVITDDSATGYLLPLTDDKESCFDAFYSNAKSFNNENSK